MHSSTARSLRAGEAERGREAVPQEDDEEEEVQERPLRRGGALLVPGQLEVTLRKFLRFDNGISLDTIHK